MPPTQPPVCFHKVVLIHKGEQNFQEPTTVPWVQCQPFPCTHPPPLWQSLGKPT